VERIKERRNGGRAIGGRGKMGRSRVGGKGGRTVAMSQICLLSLISSFVLYVWATVGPPGIFFLEPFVAAFFSVVQGVNTLGVNILPCPAVCECIVSMRHCFQLLIDLAQKSL